MQATSSIMISKNSFMFVPMLDFQQEWTEEKIHTLFHLNKEEIECIENTIKPMDLGGTTDGE